MCSGEIFLRNFLPYPPKYSRVKGGDVIYHDKPIWLVVSTPLKNMSQWEGLYHILWKLKVMFQTTIFHFLMRPAVVTTAARLGHSCT